MTNQNPTNPSNGNNPGFPQQPGQPQPMRPEAWPQPQQQNNSRALPLIVSAVTGVLALIAFWFAASSDVIVDLVSLSALSIVLTLVSCTAYLGSKMSK